MDSSNCKCPCCGCGLVLRANNQGQINCGQSNGEIQKKTAVRVIPDLATDSSYGTLPIRSNNPFALIQKSPDNWKGLKGANSNGFLHFETIEYGIRAGFINLYNTYIKRGRNTIAKIMPIYAPSGHGNNNPSIYIANMVALTGMGKDEIITDQDLLNVGRAITRIESGVNISESALLDGYKMFKNR